MVVLQPCTAFLGDIEVTINGGYVSQTKGHILEISAAGNSIPQTTSVWDLRYLNEKSAEKIFRKYFSWLENKKTPLMEAAKVDRRRRKSRDLPVVQIKENIINIKESETELIAA